MIFVCLLKSRIAMSVDGHVLREEAVAKESLALLWMSSFCVPCRREKKSFFNLDRIARWTGSLFTVCPSPEKTSGLKT